jgi:hypothetical protein
MKVRHKPDDMVTMYMRAAGQGEVPPLFHEWCCLTSIAAAVGNRVGFYTRPYKKIKPNLYTFLIADSGVGKGEALDFAAQFRLPIMNVFNGSLTHKRMIDLLKRTPGEGEGYFDYSCMFVNSAELANTAGTDALAKQLVKAMTDWYTAHGMQVEGTRLHGDNEFAEPTINWIAGTTIEWLTDVVDHKALRSGFFGRVVPIKGIRQPRVPKTVYPDDYDQLVADLCARFEDLTTVRGDFKMTREAEETNVEWYLSQPPPPKDLAAFAARERVLSIKLAMLHSLSESLELVIKKHHILEAQRRVENVRRMFISVCGDATSSQQYQMQQRVLEEIKASKRICHTKLQRKMQKFMNGATVNRSS